MENPNLLFSQFAAECGISTTLAKRGLMMKAYAEAGKPLSHAAKMLKLSDANAKAIARKLMIDFSDYRPFSRIEKAGGVRPDPIFKDGPQLPSLPLFS